MSKLIKIYNSDIEKKKIFYDKKQELVIKELNELIKVLISKEKKRESIFFSDIFNFFKKESMLGLYIWSDVGRGKTYLVDLFYSVIETKKKTRLHFHHFMKTIHNKLKENSGEKDPLKNIAKWLSENYTIICLDEFFVKDIADAMNLSKLFLYLFELDVFFVITSNVIPNKLYEGGLQRQKFLPTINLLEKHLKIINMDGGTDYRTRNLEKEKIFFTKFSYSHFKSMKNLFIKLSANSFKKKTCIDILGRKIKAVYISGTIAWFDFKNICGNGRSQMDYMEIASLFDTIFLSNIKIMKGNNEDEARRFISLIDELYDRKINIIISCETEINNLYKGDILRFDFRRTISRLNEMSTKEYLKDFDKNVF